MAGILLDLLKWMHAQTAALEAARAPSCAANVRLERRPEFPASSFNLRQKGSIRIRSGLRKTLANPQDLAGVFGERLGYGQPLRRPQRDSKLTRNRSVRHASGPETTHSRMMLAIEPCRSAEPLPSGPDAS